MSFADFMSVVPVEIETYECCKTHMVVMLDNWQRLERLVMWRGLSVNSFALSIGLSRAENLYRIKRGLNGISRDLAGLIVAKYPEVSRAWLLTGEGEMFVRSEVEPGVPLFDADVALYVEHPEEYSAESFLNISLFHGCSFAARSYDRAMAPSIKPGAYVVFKHTTLDEVRSGGEYLVVVGSKAMIRRVLVRHESRSLRLEAADEGCPVVRVAKSRIEAVYEVCGVIEERREYPAARQRRRSME